MAAGNRPQKLQRGAFIFGKVSCRSGRPEVVELAGVLFLSLVVTLIAVAVAAVVVIVEFLPIP